MVFFCRRVRLSDGRDPIVADCPECTTPESSGKISIQLANELHDGRFKVIRICN